MGYAQKLGPLEEIFPVSRTNLTTGAGDKLGELNNKTAKPHIPPDYTGIIVDFQEDAHIGKRKKEQQDAHGHLFMLPDYRNGRVGCYLFVVADGVSLGQAGALASLTAVNTLLKHFKRLLEDGQSDLSLALEAAYNAANSEVFHLAKTRPGMATTCTAALLAGRQLITAHVGDSRAYLLRAGKGLMPLSVDHSWIAEMGESLVQQGLMTRDELQRDARRHTITRAFGVQEKIQADFNSAMLEEDDLVILCSDGLWDVLPEGQLEQAQLEGNDLAAFNRKLIEAALDNGGRDNITISSLRVERLGPPAKMPALEKLLENTAHDLKERTRPHAVERQRRAATTFDAERPPERSSERPPAKEPTKASESPKLYQTTGHYETLPPRADFLWESDDPPSYRPPAYNPEMMLTKAQKTFALGEWDEAISQFIELELLEASYQGLFESLSGALIRYVGIAIGEGRITQADAIVKRLESNQIFRYTDLLADYCNEEGRRAVNARHYIAARAYAQFALRLRPSDMRARNLAELSDLYLILERPKATLSERLAVAQKIYARDENFGAIQEELAAIYMELGDEAAATHNLQDAAAWYGMIMPLRTADATLLGQANAKQRAVRAEIARQPALQIKPVPATPVELPTAANPAMPSFNSTSISLRTLERERIINDGKPELELVNRLKERVSRAQKAWDGGRKEVGSEYIYLVDQLNDLMTPNPWQSTLPRVCYDYAKWLLEQKQFEEARPYFQKASQLGMAAAQQRLTEIDRLIRERGPYVRPLTPVRLPENSANSGSPSGQPARSAAEPAPLPPETPQPRSTLSQMASLFTAPRKSAPAAPLANPTNVAPAPSNVESRNAGQTPEASKAENRPFNNPSGPAPVVESRPVSGPYGSTIVESRPVSGPLKTPALAPRPEAALPARPARSGPIVAPSPPPPADTNFIGATHAGDGILNPKAPANPVIGSLGPTITPLPRQAAAIASGNWNWAAVQEIAGTIPPARADNNTDNSNPEEPQADTTVMFAPNGTLRGSIAALNPLQEAVTRESRRLAATNQPQKAEQHGTRRRLKGTLGMIKGVLLPGLALGVVILAVLLVILTVIPKIRQAAEPTLPAGVSQVTAAPATSGATAAATTNPITIPALSGVNGVVRIEGARVEDIKVFLATAGDPNSPYRELSQETGYFRLPASALNKLDPKQKYTVVARPKDTAERKFAENLPPENPAQQAFTWEVSFDPAKGFDIIARVSPEALAFYPLKGGDADADVSGGRYIGATRHSVRGEFLKFYNANGGLARFGYPLSEEFDWSGNGRVQFFERGWLSLDPQSRTITTGKVGKALLESSCNLIPRVPANLTPIAVPTLKVDSDLAAHATTTKIGAPLTQAFEVAQGQNKIKMQYFEFGRIELNLTDKKAAPGLGLVGAEYARCVGWYK